MPLPRRPLAAALTAVASFVLLVPDRASAHGLVGREDLPLPPWLFAWAAAIVLIVSFAGLAALWPSPRLEQRAPRRRLPVPIAAEILLGAAGVAAFAVTVYAGFAGAQVDTANLAPTVIFVLFWVVVPVLSAIFGDVFQFVSPWRAVGRAAGWAALRVARGRLPEPPAYPARLGRWPAVVGVAGFGWVELVSPDRGDPSFLAALAVVYACIQLVGMTVYGERAWTEHADAFGGMFALYGRLSPLEWRDGALWTRPVLSGTTTLPATPGVIALLCTMIGVTTYDGFSQGSIWLDVLPRLQDAGTGLGLGPSAALAVAGTAGLLAVIGLVSGLFRIGIDGVRTATGEQDARAIALAFAHSLIPIALAYLVAHYLSLVAFQGQALAYLVSDPLGDGSDLFGTAGRAIDYGWLGTNAIWYCQVAALVAGHVAGLVLAHDRAIARYRDARVATRSQYWMLTVMVAFTSIGLWLLSSAAQ